MGPPTNESHFQNLTQICPLWTFLHFQYWWIYDRLGEEMEETQKKSKEMGADEAMQRAKMIFQCWMDKPIRENIFILRM
jgi:hypothetical protein